MFGDGRPYPVALLTLDAEEVLPWAAAEGLPADLGTLAAHPRVAELVRSVVDEVNERQSRVAQIKRYAILARDLSQESGELTPTLKVKRQVVAANHAGTIETLYT
jgi:long-chain acyl-CoA synthetase